MKLSLSDLPIDVRQAYEASAAQGAETLKFRNMAAVAEIEAIAVVDNLNGLMYITRDSGNSFETEAIAETIHLRGDSSSNEGVTVRHIIRVREA